MILSNVAIHRAIDEGDFAIDPEPQRAATLANPKSPYDTTSLNLTLGSKLSVADQALAVTIDLTKGNAAPTLARLYKPAVVPDAGYELVPRTFVLGQTVEHIRLPIRSGRPVLAARVEGRSSFARCGVLVHFTAPTIHAGFAGTITLEIMNLGPHSIMLRPGMQICQLILEEVEGFPTDAPSQFQGQTTPAGLHG